MKRYDWIREPIRGDGSWARRHLQAVRIPNGGPTSMEESVVGLIKAWNNYAHAHKARFESEIGEDGVLGPAWAQIGAGIRTLLNGDLGRLDAGTLDTILHDNLKEQGFDPDTL